MRILSDAAALFIAQTSTFTAFCREPIDLRSGFDGELYALYLPSEH
jgi:hypothetical protein